MIEVILALVGLALGVVIGLLLGKTRASGALSAAHSESAVALSRADALETRVAELAAASARREDELRAEHERYVSQVRSDQAVLKEQFQSLAGEALKAQSEQFLLAANERFSRAQEASEAELAKREEAVKQLVEPMAKA